MTLKNRLKSLRAEIDVNQQYVAKYLGISNTQYSQKETGKYDFTLTECKKLSVLFDKSIDEIFFTDLVNYKNTSIVCPAREIENS